MRFRRALLGAIAGLCGALGAAPVVSADTVPGGTLADPTMSGKAVFGLAVPRDAVAADRVQVFPSGATVAQNLLRISLEFGQTMPEGTLTHLHLRNCGGTGIEAPFLEQELWSPDAQRLTLLMHPGRVKTGLRANQELGRALPVGGCVEMTFDERVIKTWRVLPAVTQPLQPGLWRLDVPRPRSRAPLVVRLNRPVDKQSQSLIAVQAQDGTRVAGEGTFDTGETVWRFEPAAAWQVGGYVVRCHPAFEDPQGNRIGASFEHRADSVHHVAASAGGDAGCTLKFNIADATLTYPRS